MISLDRQTSSAESAFRQLVLLFAAGAALALPGCSKSLPLAAPAAPLTPPTRLCGAAEAPPICRSPSQLERLLSEPPQIVGMADTPSGAQGAKILTLRGQAAGKAVVFRAKWRSQSSGGLLNEPRKELAAYALQKLFLDESELVAPPTVAVCFPLDAYRRFAPAEPSSFDSADCVLGFASYWLESVHSVSAAREDGLLGPGDGIWDQQLYARDAEYRASISRANLLTYLINHGDAHTEQFMLQKQPRGLRAYVVDNSIAFLSIKNPVLLFREDWSRIQVPALSKRAVERLRALTEQDFAGLGNIGELELRGRQVVHVPDAARSAKSDGTAMSWSGPRLRFGLTTAEIELFKSRVQILLNRPDLAKLTGA